jgi:hypothetical protein
MATAMRIANLDGDPCGDLSELLCQMPSQPDVENEPLVYGVTVAYRTRETLEVALSYTGASAGTVSGYFDGGNTGTNDSDAELWVEMRERTLALSARYVLNSFVRVGGGPALHVQRTLVTTASDFRRGGRTDTHTTVRPGLLLEVSGVWPARSSFFVECADRYSWASAATFGPYDALNEQSQRRATMGATRESFAHFTVGVGAGLRF